MLLCTSTFSYYAWNLSIYKRLSYCFICWKMRFPNKYMLARTYLLHWPAYSPFKGLFRPKELMKLKQHTKEQLNKSTAFKVFFIFVFTSVNLILILTYNYLKDVLLLGLKFLTRVVCKAAKRKRNPKYSIFSFHFKNSLHMKQNPLRYWAVLPGGRVFSSLALMLGAGKRFLRGHQVQHVVPRPLSVCHTLPSPFKLHMSFSKY